MKMERATSAVISRSLASFSGDNFLTINALDPICAFCGNEVELIIDFPLTWYMHISDGTPICGVEGGFVIQ